LGVYWRETNLMLDEHFLSAKDAEKWDQALCAVGVPDTYFTAAYHRLSEVDYGRCALAYFHQVENHALFHPFLIEPSPMITPLRRNVSSGVSNDLKVR